ncbi:pyridoxal phosphate-dependent transferase [Melampsora americana]|nr:pyridoxal phosphate-dependent transferase [Melampsora americana]
MTSQSNRSQTINLGAGPCTLPTNVLETAARGLLDYNQTGIGLVELSHRSKDFQAINQAALDRLRTLLEVPDQFEILFMQGGGLQQFSCVVLNLINQFRLQHRTLPNQIITSAYLITGNWSQKAAEESIRLGCPVHTLIDSRKFSSDGKSFKSIPNSDQWSFDLPTNSLQRVPAFVYYCDNETVNGVEFGNQGFDVACLPPSYDSVPLVADMSSNILSRRISPALWDRLGVVFAGAQKNMGPSGLTTVIVRKDLLINLDEAIPFGGFRVPAMLSYKNIADHQSLYNTPPMFSIYVCNLVFEDLISRGGVKMIEQVNFQKASAVYKIIDESHGFYVNPIEPGARSRMNVVFTCSGGTSVEDRFIAAAHQEGIKQIKGHRSIGGIRTSLYNAVTLEQVERLCKFMLDL